ncbi:hypothetical protein V6Z98_010114 [Aspergillus fumigatus]
MRLVEIVSAKLHFDRRTHSSEQDPTRGGRWRWVRRLTLKHKREHKRKHKHNRSQEEPPPQRSIPSGDRDRDRDGAAPVRQQQQLETRLQRGSRILTKTPGAQKKQEEGVSVSSTAVPATATLANTRRQSLIRPSPLKTGTATATATGAGTRTGTNPGGRAATTPKSATFSVQGLSTFPMKRDGVASMSPKRTEMPPPARLTRSASMGQPLKAGTGTGTGTGAGAGAGSGTPATGVRHVRHRSQIVAPSSSQGQVSRRSDSESSGSTPMTTPGLAAGTRPSGRLQRISGSFRRGR